MGFFGNTVHEAISREFCERLLAKSRELESHSSIEIVPVIKNRSDHYFDFRVQVALLGALCASIGGAALSTSWIQAALLSALTFACVFGAVSFPAVLRLVLPASLAREAAADQAGSAFLHEEVFATKARTGILIFLSVFEREIFVIGDKGLAAHVPADYWSGLGAALAKDFRAKNPGASFIEALEKLTHDVAPLFPADVDNPNELSDELRRR